MRCVWHHQPTNKICLVGYADWFVKLASVSDMLSKLFHNDRSPGIFDIAKCEGLRFHDLRHEATSRLFERTSLSETQIMKITGHKSHKMMMRYANLRASDMAEGLW